MEKDIWWDIIGILAAACTSSGLIPQLIRGVKTKRLDDVSPGLLILLGVGCALWFVYGLHKRDKIIMGANAFVVVMTFVILSLRAHYIKKRGKLYDGRDKKRHR